MEAEDDDGDTALHLVLLQMKNSREATSTMTLFLNVLFRVQPQNVDKAPAINKARQLSISPTCTADELEVGFRSRLISSGVFNTNRYTTEPTTTEPVQPRVCLWKLLGNGLSRGG